MPPVISLLILLFVVIAFGVLLVFLTSKLGPKPKDCGVKSEAYECGLDSVPVKQNRVSVNFYLTAILFVLFDIEIIFLYPWAVAYQDFISEGLGLYVFIGMATFLTIFVLGLFWEIKSKALSWD